MFTYSLWNSFSAATDFPTLLEDLEVDVAIIGGGIMGITTAQLLAEAGLQVVVLEARKVGGGATAHSTGNLYITIDQTLSSLQSKYDNQIIRKIVSSRQDAMELMADNVKRFSIDCDFNRVPWLMYTDTDSKTQKITKELETAKELGIVMEEARRDDIPFYMSKGVKLEGQAQFNPMRYVQRLATSIQKNNCLIYENSRVTDIQEEEGQVQLKTPNCTIRAKHCFHATHTPKGVEVQFHTVLGPYREYGIAARLKAGTYPEGIFWRLTPSGQKVSFRSYTRGDQQFIIAVGQPHKVGQSSDNQEHFENLEAFLRDYFELAQVTHRWGSQHYKPADKLPYIGRKKRIHKFSLPQVFQQMVWSMARSQRC